MSSVDRSSSLRSASPFLTLAAVTASFLIFAVVTAFFFSCLLPTLFLPRAAQAVPVSAQTRAMTAMTIAGDGRRETWPLIRILLLVNGQGR